MKWLKRNKNDEEVSYWQSIADGLAALLLMVLLLLTILILLITQHTKDADPSPDGWLYPEMTIPNGEDYDDHAGGWGDGIPVPTEEHGGGGGGEPTEPTQPVEIHIGDDGDAIAAVMVRVLDAQTQRLIRESGVTFEVYTEWGALEVLNTYYPQKITYKSFDTTENGTFFLPEKIELGNYYLSEKTEPYGYDAGESVSMHIDDTYDWDAPYIVDVLLYPSRNKICVQVSDKETGTGLSGAGYDVFAYGDVVTADGTLRYADGELVDHISCDADGYGESGELYLGAYQLRQTDIPRFYAGEEKPVEAQTQKRRQGEDTALLPILSQKTTVILKVSDELYQEQPVSQARFALSGPGLETAYFTSDAAGSVSFTNLEKDTTYTVIQEDSGNGYRPSGEALTFYVSAEGLVDGGAVAAMTMTNRMLRLSVQIHDALLPGSTVVRGAALTDAAGNVVDHWDVNGAAHVCEGLAPGTYWLRVNNKLVREVLVEETAGIQSVRVPIWTATSVAVLFGLFCILAAGLYFGIRKLLGRKRRKG